MRFLALLAAVACGSSYEPPTPRQEKPRLPALDLPVVADADRVVRIDAATPTAIVYVGGAGKLTLQIVEASWDGKLDPLRGAPTTVDDLATALHDRLIEAGGERAAIANEARRPRSVGSVPARLPEVAAGLPIAEMPRATPLVAAVPTAPAVVVARVLAATGGLIAVQHAGRLCALDRAFVRAAPPGGSRSSDPVFHEVGLYAESLIWDVYTPARQSATLERVVVRGRLLLAQQDLEAALRELYEPPYPIDVAVGPDLTVQLLVDVLAALMRTRATELNVVQGPATHAVREP
jgi:hypothetical protein